MSDDMNYLCAASLQKTHYNSIPIDIRAMTDMRRHGAELGGQEAARILSYLVA